MHEATRLATATIEPARGPVRVLAESCQRFRTRPETAQAFCPKADRHNLDPGKKFWASARRTALFKHHAYAAPLRFHASFVGSVGFARRRRAGFGCRLREVGLRFLHRSGEISSFSSVHHDC